MKVVDSQQRWKIDLLVEIFPRKVFLIHEFSEAVSAEFSGFLLNEYSTQEQEFFCILKQGAV